jgi:hypothetical protein
MEKISRILPPSRRVTAVDVVSNQPVRPGAPEYGRPSRTSSLDVQDRVSLSSLANSRAPEPTATYKNTSKESARAKAVEEIAEKFFNPRTFAKEGDSTLSEDTLKNLEDARQVTVAGTGT